MGRTHSRLGAYALAVLTCFALIGVTPAALADDSPKVHGSGWYFNFFNEEVKFGVEGKFKHNMAPDGRFEFYVKGSPAKTIHGKIMTWEPMTDACGPGVPPPFQGPPAGAPGAKLHGECDDHGNCTFDMNVVDGGHKNDWVCLVHVNGTDKKGNGIAESQDSPQPLVKGNIEVKNAE